MNLVVNLKDRFASHPLAILTNHFLGRYFETEEAQSGELRTGIPALLGLAAAPGFILCSFLFEKYSTLIGWFKGIVKLDRDLTTLHDKYIFLAIAFVVCGIATVMKWNNLFPDRRDYMILAPLPIRPSTVFLAKLLGLVAFVSLFAVAVNIVGCLLFPSVVLGNTGTFSLLVRYMLSHFVATLCSSLGGALLVIVVAGFWMNVLPVSTMRRVSSWLQFVLLVFFLTQLLLAAQVAETLALLQLDNGWRILLFPPLWFLGLYEQLLGHSVADLSLWASYARLSLSTCAVAAVVFYVLGYVRHFRRTAETSDAVVAPGRLLRLLPIPSDPHEAAIVDFVKQTISRSGLHRLLLRTFLAAGCAVILHGLASRFVILRPEASDIGLLVFAGPLVISFFLLVGLRFLLEIPSERQASWIFRLAIPDSASRAILRGVRRVMFELGILAWLVLIVPVNIVLLGASLGVAHSLFCLLASLIALDALLIGYHKAPFTTDFNSERTNLGISLLLWSTLFAVYAYGTTYIEVGLLQRPVVFALTLALMFGVWRFLLYARDLWTPEHQEMDFSDGVAPVVLTLDLRND